MITPPTAAETMLLRIRAQFSIEYAPANAPTPDHTFRLRGPNVAPCWFRSYSDADTALDTIAKVKASQAGVWGVGAIRGGYRFALDLDGWAVFNRHDGTLIKSGIATLASAIDCSKAHQKIGYVPEPRVQVAA